MEKICVCVPEDGPTWGRVNKDRRLFLGPFPVLNVCVIPCHTPLLSTSRCELSWRWFWRCLPPAARVQFGHVLRNRSALWRCRNSARSPLRTHTDGVVSCESVCVCVHSRSVVLYLCCVSYCAPALRSAPAACRASAVWSPRLWNTLLASSPDSTAPAPATHTHGTHNILTPALILTVSEGNERSCLH